MPTIAAGILFSLNGIHHIPDQGVYHAEVWLEMWGQEFTGSVRVPDTVESIKELEIRLETEVHAGRWFMEPKPKRR